MRRLVVILLTMSCVTGLDERDNNVVDNSNSPVQDFLPHHYVGAFTDQVAGNDYACFADVALVVDVSSSIGAAVLGSTISPLVTALNQQLQRLPAGRGDLKAGTQLVLVLFNETAQYSEINSLGAEVDATQQELTSAFRSHPQKGGSCISCGLEEARQKLYSLKRPSTTRQFVVLITDGLDHDGRNNSPISPIVAASNIKGEDILIFAASIVGKKGGTDDELLSLIASTPESEYLWSLTDDSQYSGAAIGIVDSIAGAACLA